MSDNTEEEDCGCNSPLKKELDEKDIEKLKDSMEETKEKLNQAFETIGNFSMDFSKFEEMQENLNNLSKFLYSGEFIKTLETTLEKTKSKQENISSTFKSRNMPNFDVPKKEKIPIGYVWIDENGEQKFSVVKPDDVVAMAVYGE